MGDIATVITREYLERTRTKGFLIGTILAPVIMAGMILVPGLLTTMSTGKQWNIAVVDRSGQIFPRLQEALDDTLRNGQPAFLLHEACSAQDRWEITQAGLKRQVVQGVISAYVIIDSEILATGQAQLYAKNVGDFITVDRIESAIDRIVVGMRLGQEGLDPEQIDHLTRRVKLKTLKVSKGEQQESGFGQIYRDTFIFVFILYMTILLYGVAVMRGILEEKSSRIVEILLSSLKPAQLMAGKILGVGCVGLTQYLIWIAFGASLSIAGAAYLGTGGLINVISPSIFLYFLLFYLLGYFLYATLYAAIGAVCTTEQEAQQIQFPLVALLVIPLLLMPLVIRNPDGITATVLSLIPFFSPTLMFLRINVAAPPLSHIILSIGLLVASILAMIKLVARIFRVGILMYGKRPSLPEVLRWLRTS